MERTSFLFQSHSLNFHSHIFYIINKSLQLMYKREFYKQIKKLTDLLELYQ